jgi:hypothetical protein
VKTRRWHSKGQLALLNPHPSAALVDAIDAIDESISAREEFEIHRAEEDRARKTRVSPNLALTKPSIE